MYLKQLTSHPPTSDACRERHASANYNQPKSDSSPRLHCSGP